MEGELRDRQLVSALRLIGRKGKTGILTVQGRDEIIAFSFSDGGIVGADALNQSLEQGLGEVLSSQELVDSGEFAALVAEHEAGGGRVIDLLVERSFLSRSQLLEALRLHTYRLCLEALAWKEGEYRFYQGDEVAHESGVDPIGVGELLVRSGEDLGTAGPISLPVPRLEDIYVRVPDAFAKADGGGDSGVTEDGRRVLELFDGQRTLREVAAHSELSAFDVRDMAGECELAGLIEKTGTGLAAEVAEQALESLDAVLAEEPEVESVAWAPEAAPAADLGYDSGETFPVDDDAAADFDFQQVEIPSRDRAGASRFWQEAPQWLNRAFGLTFLVVTLALLFTGPGRVVLPFPWQGASRSELEGARRAAQRLKIESGARTFFLLSGRYPERFSELQELGLVDDADLIAPGGSSWELSATPASFVLSVPVAGGEAEGASWTTSIAGNFLLDPEYSRPVSGIEGPLLVLLD